jgi:ligand-binding SRPBCC domain-containing protein
LASIHRLLYRQEVLSPLEEVFAFFGDAKNLPKLSPPTLRFQFLSTQPIELSAGVRIDYRIRLMGVSFRWQTLISDWDPPHSFVDEQSRGPYHTWQHTHRFWPRGDQTIIDDEVHYALPFWPVGELALPLVRYQLKKIFAYRHAAIADHFGTTTAEDLSRG